MNMTVKFWAILNKRSAIIINEYTPWDSIHFLRYLGLFVFVFNETKHFHTECFWTVGHWRYLRKKFFAHYWQKLSTYYYPNYQVLCEKFKPLTFIQLPKLESSLHRTLKFSLSKSCGTQHCHYKFKTHTGN